MGKPPQYSRDELLDALHNLASDLDKRPTQREMREHGPYSVNAYKRAFGSWSEALNAAGFDLPAKGRTTTKEDLLDALRGLADELGRSPTQADINIHTDHSAKTYYRKFDGGLREAKERLGLKHHDENQRDKVEIECANCGESFKRAPSNAEKSQYSYCSKQCEWDHKGERYSGKNNPVSTLQEVECDNCGETILRPNWKIERNEIHVCDRDCYSEWCSDHRRGEDHPAWKEYPYIECDTCGKPFQTKPAYAENGRRFCSRACKHEWQSTAYIEEGNPNYGGGGFPRMGPNWAEQRGKRLIIDQARCQNPVCEYNNIAEHEHLRIFGEGLTAHHIIPREQFYDGDTFDWENANRTENLRIVCRACHQNVEANRPFLTEVKGESWLP